MPRCEMRYLQNLRRTSRGFSRAEIHVHNGSCNLQGNGSKCDMGLINMAVSASIQWVWHSRPVNAIFDLVSRCMRGGKRKGKDSLCPWRSLTSRGLSSALLEQWSTRGWYWRCLDPVYSVRKSGPPVAERWTFCSQPSDLETESSCFDARHCNVFQDCTMGNGVVYNGDATGNGVKLQRPVWTGTKVMLRNGKMRNWINAKSVWVPPPHERGCQGEHSVVSLIPYRKPKSKSLDKGLRETTDAPLGSPSQGYDESYWNGTCKLMF